MSRFRTEITVMVEVDYSYIGGMRGSRDRYGIPEEPDEEPYCELESVTLGGVELVDVLPECILNDLASECLEKAQEYSP